MPPTEKRGRVHTSTVTVAVLDSDVKAEDKYTKVEESDFRIEWFSGTGAGGQHRNKVQNSCRMIHIPTGIIETRQGRERSKNLKEAKDAILKTLEQHGNRSVSSELSTERKGQVGSGMRGDKTVTIRFQDDRVSHSNGRGMTATRYMKGHMDEIWE